MASEVQIANLALSHLGDDATVSNLNPPEGSAQAQHCAQFYPIARDTILEMHPWNFATKRVIPALIASTTTEWDYSYAAPTDALTLFAVMPPNAADDYSAPAYPPTSVYGNNFPIDFMFASKYQTQPFSVETSPTDGTAIIYTDQPEAHIRYIARITDTTKFSPLFTLSLSWLLASFLAGPLYKGDVGAAMGKNCYQMFMQMFGQAAKSDANQRHTDIKQSVQWMANR